MDAICVSVVSSQRLSQMTVLDGLSLYLPVKRWPDKRCWFLKHKRGDWLVQTLQWGYLSAFQLWRSTLLLWQAKTPVDSNYGWLTNWYENKYCHDMKKIILGEIIHLQYQPMRTPDRQKEKNLTWSLLQLENCISIQFFYSGITVSVHLNLTATLRSLISNYAHVFKLGCCHWLAN